MGLINQATDRAPVWLIKKLTATYLTLGLSDIGREVGIDSPEEVREIILSMVRINRITFSPLSALRGPFSVLGSLIAVDSRSRSTRGRSTRASPTTGR